VGSGFGAGSKKRWRPIFAFILTAIASSSLEGADDSAELSESAIAFVVSRVMWVGRKDGDVECHKVRIELENASKLSLLGAMPV
jgi:hypothetical protein